MVLFALSCVGLLLFLWLSFGGSIPFNAQGYRFKVAFSNAFNLADQADVRIAGVNVGKVVAKQITPRGNSTVVTIQMQNQYAPIHRDATAILRTKTLLGETYVQLTPGAASAPALPDGGTLNRSHVQQNVQLSQIFDTFDPTTRQAFRTWQQTLAQAVSGNGQNLNDVLGNLPTFATNLTQLLTVLDVQHSAVVSLSRNGGTTFNALNRDPAALHTLITAGDTTFSTTAANANAIADIFHVFPTFLTEQRLTLAALKGFSLNADPVIRELIPVAQQLTPTLQAVNNLAPYLRNLFVELGPLVDAANQGLPATERVLKGLNPGGLLNVTQSFLGQLNPILGWLALHQQLISDFLGAGGVGLFDRTTSFSGHGTGHYLRQVAPSGPETLSFSGGASGRDPNNRGNVYPEPLWLPGGEPRDFTRNNLPAWDCKNSGYSGPEGQQFTPSAGPPPEQACWVQPQLPGSPGAYQIPHITATAFSKK
jgi:phospholipid/cholesterol/gamma-HCH transport system substrate-binding protein